MVYAAPPLRERALRPGRSGDDEARVGDRGGEGIPVLTSNPPPRSSCEAVSEVKASQRHGGGIDGIGSCLSVGAARGRARGRAHLAATTTFITGI